MTIPASSSPSFLSRGKCWRSMRHVGLRNSRKAILREWRIASRRVFSSSDGTRTGRAVLLWCPGTSCNSGQCVIAGLWHLLEHFSKRCLDVAEVFSMGRK